MKNAFNIFWCLVVLLLSFGCSTPESSETLADSNVEDASAKARNQPQEPACSVPDVNPFDMVARMGRGINLGNVLSAPVEGNWALPVEQTYFQDVAAAGFKTVRIPIRFDTYTTALADVNYENNGGKYIASPDSFQVDSAYLDRIEQVITWAMDENLIAIIDVHGDHWFWESYDVGSTYYKTGNERLAAEDRFRAIWKAISNRFACYSENLLFEIMNEAYFSMSAQEVDFINSEMLRIIRETNPTRNVIVTGGGKNSWEAPLQMNNSFLNSDEHLIATFHYYIPFKFTSSSKENNNVFDWGSQTDINLVNTHFDAVESWAQTVNKPVLLGEYGADNVCGFNYDTGQCGAFGGPTEAAREAYHRYIADAALERGFACTVWDAGHKSNKTIYRADNRSWVDSVKNAVLGIQESCTASQFIANADIECGTDKGWSLLAKNGADAILQSAEPQEVAQGSTTINLQVSSTANLNDVILNNTTSTGQEWAGKRLRISCTAKAETAAQVFKMRLKASGVTATIYNGSPTLNLSNVYQTYSFDYDVPADLQEIQFQLICGSQAGNYWFDDFTVEILN
ncbi:MAG: hypothetical protein COA80_11920 [Leeuwenhoekiella sp.]|nr:MAG: hypothetical protein COA80_11920 [Leeuwenhoekiella sp.]